ncbi:hypothetical protein Tco_0076641, partial [Tanacetum coccineum]
MFIHFATHDGTRKALVLNGGTRSSLIRAKLL